MALGAVKALPLTGGITRATAGSEGPLPRRGCWWRPVFDVGKGAPRSAINGQSENTLELCKDRRDPQIASTGEKCPPQKANSGFVSPRDLVTH